jgi:hypothetical protein
MTEHIQLMRLTLDNVAMRNALELIARTYIGDRDYPGIIARRALDGCAPTRKAHA